MIRDATPADLPAIQAFLTAQRDQAMFPLANLGAHGLTKGDFASPHDHALRIWLLDRSVIALTRAGNLLWRSTRHPAQIAGRPAPAQTGRIADDLSWHRKWR